MNLQKTVGELKELAHQARRAGMRLVNVRVAEGLAQTDGDAHGSST